MTNAEINVFPKDRWFERTASLHVSEQEGNRQIKTVEKINLTVEHGVNTNDPVTLTYGEEQQLVHPGESKVFAVKHHYIKVNHEGRVEKFENSSKK